MLEDWCLKVKERYTELRERTLCARFHSGNIQDSKVKNVPKHMTGRIMHVWLGFFFFF